MVVIPTIDDKGVALSEDDRFERVLKVEGHIINGSFYLLSVILGAYVVAG